MAGFIGGLVERLHAAAKPATQAAPKLNTIAQTDAKVAASSFPTIAATSTEVAAKAGPTAKVAAAGLVAGTAVAVTALSGGVVGVASETCNAVLGADSCKLVASKLGSVQNALSSWTAGIGEIATVAAGGLIVAICTYAGYEVGGGWVALGTGVGGSLAVLAVVQPAPQGQQQTTL